MRVRALTSSGDWTFGQGQNDYVVAQQAVRQIIQTRVLSFLGNCFFDLGAGIDWFNLLGTSQQQALNLAISAVILNLPPSGTITGIVQTSLTYSPASRNISFTYQVISIYSVLQGTFAYDLGGSA